MKATVLVGILVLVASLTVDAQVGQELYGTWRLVSFTQQVVATGQTEDPYGKAPKGFINFSPDGRMYAIVVRDNRPKPADLTKMTDQERAELFKTMLAFAGTFKLDGDRVMFNVDISWNENWTGTTQVRNVRIEGRTLVLSTGPFSGPDGRQVAVTVTWEKVQ
jgi:hypothetical protein